MYNNRTWQLIRRTGNFDDLEVKVSFDAADNIGFETDSLTIVQADTKNGVYQSLGAASTGNGTVGGTATTIVSPSQNYIALGVSQNTILKLKVFLQGNYNNATNSITLNTRMQEALQNQYDGDTGIAANTMYKGYHVPTNAIDVVDIKLRETFNGPFIETRPAFLLTDGTIKDFETGRMDTVAFTRALSGGSYHIVISHRNHLSVQHSNTHMLLARIEGPAVDFTSISNIYGGGAVNVDMTPATYAMIAGNADNNDSETNANDLFDVQLVEANLLEGYHREDIDLNGSVNATDRNITSFANDFLYFSTVP